MRIQRAKLYAKNVNEILDTVYFIICFNTARYIVTALFVRQFLAIGLRAELIGHHNINLNTNPIRFYSTRVVPIIMLEVNQF